MLNNEEMRLEIDKKGELRKLVRGYILQPDFCIEDCLKQMTALHQGLIELDDNMPWSVYIFAMFHVADINFQAVDISMLEPDEHEQSLEIEEDIEYLHSLIAGYANPDSDVRVMTMAQTVKHLNQTLTSLKNEEITWAHFLLETREITRQNWEALHIISTAQSN